MAKKGSKDSAVYKVIEIVGTSGDSWAAAGANAVKTASRTLRDLRVAEVKQLDMKVDGGKIIYRVKLSVSFKFHGDD
ncbi:MAG TPA: dodecin family protein [Usitatibacter sp.]|nr:dodecin family protein [Usitatibacter sp.]